VDYDTTVRLYKASERRDRTPLLDRVDIRDFVEAVA
jgi:hypothetical protein